MTNNNDESTPKLYAKINKKGYPAHIKAPSGKQLEIKAYITLKTHQRATIGTGVNVSSPTGKPALAFITLRSGLVKGKSVAVLNNPIFVHGGDTQEIELSILNLGEQNVIIRHDDLIGYVNFVGISDKSKHLDSTNPQSKIEDNDLPAYLYKENSND